MDSDNESGGSLRLGVLLFAATLLLIGVDVIGDYLEGAGSGHISVEAGVMIVAGAGFGIFAVRLKRFYGETRELVGQLARTRRDAEEHRQVAEQHRQVAEQNRQVADQHRRDAERWREEAEAALSGLGRAIDRQFERWQLSPAERNVGLLLLKGLSHKEIASVRGVSERTVRQQARALYGKAGLSGRAELSAYFLEDLLLPAESSPAPPAGEG